MRRAFISAFGSRGDVNPMLAIASELRQRNWHVVVAIGEPYAHLVTAINCQPVSIVSHDDFANILGDPDLWRPFSGSRLIFQKAIPGFNLPYLRFLKEHVGQQPTDLLIAHPLDFAARVLHQKDPRVPLVSVHLAPTTLYDPKSPPRMTDHAWELRRPEFLVRLGYALGDRCLIQPWLRPTLAEMGQMLEMKVPHQTLKQWWTMGESIVALFPSWFATPQLDPRFFYAGFPLSDGPDLGGVEAIDNALLGFPQPPLIFTTGTAHRHASDFFKMAVETCQRLESPGLLLSSAQDQIAAPDDPLIRVVNYLPFGALLKRCRAIIHHGGIGTTGQSLAAGIPQVVVPMAFDQFDNAERVARLGCGVWIGRRSLNTDRLTKRVRAVMESASMQHAARTTASRLTRSNSIPMAIDGIENLVRS